MLGESETLAVEGVTIFEDTKVESGEATVGMVMGCLDDE